MRVKTSNFWKTTVLAGLSLALLSACVGGPRSTETQVQTGQVTSLTATSTVETAGTVEALQTATLTWKTGGQVATINVKPGDRVKRGDILLTLDPASVSQSLIQAQADLVSAQQALDDLLNPSVLAIANAKKAVADAQEALAEKQRLLRNLVSPNVAYYEDQLRRAQNTLTAAEQNAEITNFATSLKNAEDTLESATSRLNDLKRLEEQYPGYSQQHGNALENAQKSYDTALTNYQTALYNLQQAQANNTNTLMDAQEAVKDAQANVEAAKLGPDAIERAQAEAEVAVAEANLAEAEQTLADLQNGGNADDVAAARAKVQATQANVDSLLITAPFDGEVLAVENLLGDLVSQGASALTIANRTALHLDVQVDESDVTRVEIGDEVNVTFSPLDDLVLNGTVTQINPLGTTVQGLVKYTVTVNLINADARILPGMTADVAIVTDVQRNALAVPIEAVQSDDEGEYVLRVINATGATERVPVQSGDTQGDLVVIKGNLAVGDTVQLAVSNNNQLPGGGGPFGG